MKVFFFILLLSSTPLLASGINKEISSHLKRNIPTLITTKLKGYTLDPLEFENASNTYLIPILYATPVKKNVTGKRDSDILSKFKHSSKYENVTLKIKKGAKFSDGSLITSLDIATTIKRAILAGPEKFNFIIGYNKLKSVKGNITGIKIISPESLEILFNDPVAKPIGWLTELNLGVVKSTFVNEDGSLKGTSPFSTKWKIEKNTDSIIILKSGDEYLSIVEVQPSDLKNYMDFIDSNHLIIVDTGILPESDRLLLSKHLKSFYQEKVRIMYLAFDSSSKPFNDKRVRQFVSIKVRERLKKKGIRPQGSLVTFGEPEFISLNTLEKSIPEFSREEEEKIKSTLKKNKIVMKNILGTCYNHVTETLESFEVQTKSEGNSNIKCFISGITKGESLESIELFLNPGKVGSLSNIVTNKGLQSLLRSDISTIKKVSKINRYLFEEAFISVIRHNQLAHFTSKKTNILERKNFIYILEDYFPKD